MNTFAITNMMGEWGVPQKAAATVPEEQGLHAFELLFFIQQEIIAGQ